VSRQDFPSGYVCVAATIPDGIAVMLESALRCRPELRELASQALGDRWIDSRMSAVLKVSSAVVASEHNYLLNPAHPDFVRIGVEPPAMFQFDARLFG
jgi:RES domain-containing protein